MQKQLTKKERKRNMRLDMKMRKKIISLGLAFGLAATSVPLWQMPITAQAAEEVVIERTERAAVTLASVREEARAVYAASKKALDIDLSKETFNGTGVDYSGNADYISVLNNLRTGSDDQTVIIRFKTTQTGSALLFGAGTGDKTDGTDMVIGLLNGNVRIAPRSDVSGLIGTFSSATLNDGNYHTMALSFLPSKAKTENNLRIVIDGGTDIYGTNQYASTWYQRFVPGFNQRSDVAYSALKIGASGFKISDKEAMAALEGSVDFVTVINKAYTVQELQQITASDRAEYDSFGVMTASGSRNTWLFTGGTEGVADFKTSGTTRNFVGLFEDNLRAGGSYVERSRFVFNTAKRNADVATVLEKYDTMIAPYGTKAVGIIVGAADYTKGTDGIPAFKTALKALVDRIYEDDKIPFIITPYPSTSAGAAGQIAAYVEAINEVSAKRTRVVNISGLASDLVQADGSLSPAGHQTVANQVKSTLGIGGATNFNFQLQGGSYVVGKKADAAAAVEVTAGTDSVQVQVEPSSISGSSAKLSYVLTDTKGQKISGSVAAGQTAFSISGLKQGEAYVLDVCDESRGEVKEAYQPVSITVLDGEKGVSQEHRDGNVSVNEKIQKLLTSEKPVTYLFMGDSITHGIVTQGYDNVPQMFAKYLDEIGRTDDVVLNTGVSNATIATTLAQIDTRLEQHNPDVVMIMLGTNDTSVRGENTVAANGNASTNGITVEQFKDRYKELVRKIHENNAESSVVLRVPCEMIGDSAHSGYEAKFEAIYDVASEMREEIPGLNIVVVNHRQEWLDYRNNVRNDNISRTGAYGWLVDNVHPNGRGNMSMFQQIIRELGMYVPTSELANYEYALADWTGTSGIAAEVTRREARASFDMSALSGYTNGLKNVTLTLTADGVSVSRTAEYAENGTVSVDGLDAGKTYTATVTGKDAVDSKEITFNTTLTQDSNLSATEAEKKELADSIAEAKTFDTSAYPEEVRKAYEAEIQRIENSFKNAATITEIEEALTQIRAAKAGLVKAAEAAEAERKAAKENLDAALVKTEAVYQAGQKDYTQASWDAYVKAYQAAKAADDTTDAKTLKQLLEALNTAEKNLQTNQTAEDAERKAAKENLDVALAKTEVVYQAGQKDYTQASWDAYVKAYQAAKAANDTTDAKTLNQLLINLNTAEKNLKKATDTVIPVGSGRYQVTDEKQKTAKLVGVKNKKAVKLSVPATVKISGETYKVTEIGDKVMKGNSKLKKVILGSNVSKIGKQAFMGCKNLKSVQLKGKALNTIKTGAFKKTSAKMTVSAKKLNKKQKAALLKKLRKAGAGKKVKVK